MFNYGKCSNDEIIEMYNYLTTVTTVTTAHLVELLKQIIDEKKTKELGKFFINEIDSVSFSKIEILDLLDKILNYNDLEMIKYLLNKLSLQDQCNSSNNDQFIEIYGYKIKKSNIENYLSIRANSLFNSTLDDLVIQILRYSPRDYMVQKFLIRTPKIAEFLINNSDIGTNKNSKFRFGKMMFCANCLEDDLSNKELFENKPVEWRINNISNIEKFEYLKSWNLIFSDAYLTNAFNGDLKFLINYYKHINLTPTSSVLESAASLGYYDMVYYILISYPSDKWDICSLFTVLKHCLQQKEIVQLIRKIAFNSNTNLFQTTMEKFFFVSNYEERKILFGELEKIPNLIKKFINVVARDPFAPNVDGFLHLGFNPGKEVFQMQRSIKFMDSLISNNLFKELDLFIQENRIMFKKGWNGVISLMVAKSQIKMLLFLIEKRVITTANINHLIKIGVENNLPLIIDLVLMIGPFKNNGFKNLYNLSNISLSSYLNEAHYLIFYYTIKRGELLKNHYANKEKLLRDSMLIIKYLVEINYQYHNQHSDNFSFIPDTKEQLIIKYSNLEPIVKTYIKNVGLLNSSSVFFINKNMPNNNIIQLVDTDNIDPLNHSNNIFKLNFDSL
ncbi:hypothetical protein DICPUDRAFT_81940 [Dictyostelium purpureum]|uniref:Ankyrin repeat protein n=1 Tax=Dictyostelium purpureum TaxID=5786 RepID=F0ZV18_DICPU|nr:uncharacterized protein DICPUDRAFT_81940 [Dictyostelium purpureum]EGC32217.1 hypothetical protein DICPUDRAFT_81940 [Dictyostelium purpureum]|eukprot:XP_003291253.1 hypothetical protein DICPUDRAFT_81940 [Dictyostelium purpureum]